jgi:hypothetical protein
MMSSYRDEIDEAHRLAMCMVDDYAIALTHWCKADKYNRDEEREAWAQENAKRKEIIALIAQSLLDAQSREKTVPATIKRWWAQLREKKNT